MRHLIRKQLPAFSGGSSKTTHQAKTVITSAALQMAVSVPRLPRMGGLVPTGEKARGPVTVQGPFGQRPGRRVLERMYSRPKKTDYGEHLPFHRVSSRS